MSETEDNFVQGREAWLERNQKQFSTIEPIVDTMGIEHKMLYGPSDAQATNLYDQQLGFPGSFPFTRGVYSGMYRKAPWRINQYAGFGAAQDTNERWRFLYEHGQQVFNLALDLPTQMGYDSDDPEVEAEVGRAGVAIDTVDDLVSLLEGLPMVPIYFNVAGSAPIIMAMLIAAAKIKGSGPESIMGAFTNDILTTYVCRGTWIYPPEAHMKLITDMVEYSSQYMSPYFYPLNIQGVYFRSVGATQAQELAMVIADALCYVDWAIERGLGIDTFARRLSFFFSCGPEIFSEAAKFRAARRWWAGLMRERYGATEAESMRLKATAATGGRYFQAIEPLNNLVRGAYGILGAVMGGAQATFIAGYDEAYALPNEESAMLGLRTLQILQEETDLTRTIDPLGGSWYVESLTDQIQAKAEAILGEIQDHGGVLECIRTGWTRSQLDACLYKQHEGIQKGEIALVGVNKYCSDDANAYDMELYVHDEEVQAAQSRRLKEIRSSRDQVAWRKAVDSLERAVDKGENLINYLVEVALAHASVGEINSVLEKHWGRFADPNTKVA